MHPHDRIALAIGYGRTSTGEWLNSWGASWGGSPADIPWEIWKGVVTRHFEPSFNNRMYGRTERFLAEYREDMTPDDLCDLVIRVMDKSKDS
jgi:hypothetical protein